MREFIIATDSCCDFTAALIEEMELTVVPLSVLLGAESFRNVPGEGPDPQTFYQRLERGESAQTSAPNVALFKELLRPHLVAGKDILFLAFSSALSATYQNATIAADELREEFPEAQIVVIDTLCASLGQGLLVDLAVEQRRQGKSLDEVRAFVLEELQHIDHWFTVGDLKHLRRGGRLSAGKAILGSLLHIKPVMHTDFDGKLKPVETVKGRRKSLVALVDKMGELMLPVEQKVYICHSDCLEDAQFVAELVKERFQPKSVTIAPIGPVIGAHTGRNTVGLFFQGQHR